MLQILFLRCFDRICSWVKVHVCTTTTSEEKAVNTDFHYVFTSTSNTIVCCRFLRFAHICTKLNFMFASWSRDGKLIYLLHVFTVANVQKKKFAFDSRKWINSLHERVDLHDWKISYLPHFAYVCFETKCFIWLFHSLWRIVEICI